jgi:hypothetical protein
MKRLFDDNEQYNKLGQRWSVKVQKALAPVVKAAVKANISMLDLEHVILGVGGMECVFSKLDRNAKRKVKRSRKR